MNTGNINMTDMKLNLLTALDGAKDELSFVNLQINALLTKSKNINEEKEKLLNISSNNEYETIIDLIHKELINLNSKILRLEDNKNKLNSEIHENEKDLVKCDKLFEYINETSNISIDNIIGLNCINLKELSILDNKLIKEYIDFHDNINNFNVTYYLFYEGARKKYNKESIIKAIKNWMEFHNRSDNIEQRYILNVISSSAGIEGWGQFSGM